MAEQGISAGDYLTIAESVLGVDGKALRRAARLDGLESALAAPYAGFGAVDKYPGFHERAAILCSRLVRNHPLPDGNKRSALVAMIMFIELNGHRFDQPPGGQDEIAETIENLAAGTLSEEDFIAWVGERIDSQA